MSYCSTVVLKTFTTRLSAAEIDIQFLALSLIHDVVIPDVR